MGKYTGDKPYDFVIAVFDGLGTADEAFDTIKSLEGHDRLTIHDAAVFTRTDKGKIKLKNKGYVATWKGGTIGLGIGLVLGGPIGGAVVGGLIGFARGNKRRNIRGLVDEKLGSTQSALAVVAENVEWAAVEAAMERFNGTMMYEELTGDSLAALQALESDEDVVAAAEDELVVDDADVVASNETAASVDDLTTVATDDAAVDADVDAVVAGVKKEVALDDGPADSDSSADDSKSSGDDSSS
jgi:uncharacterized membrane protein